MISFHQLEDLKVPLDLVAVDTFLKWMIKDQKKELDFINFVFCSDAYLLKINQVYLNHDFLTDIITFDYEKSMISSDVYISVDRVAENADIFNVDFSTELIRVVFHGVLHLCGFKDKTKEEERIIRLKEDHYLKLFVSRET